ncbi:diacylglycerol kinase [Chitinimonas sp. PSY-7]|uniref:diacylglycerol kinase n=1 Tax=Chitinimonas sp. PSY-7 TaxID=3459088 RepID=UPI00403FFBA2
MTDPTQESPFKGKTGLRRLLNATGYSIDGLTAAWRHESAFRQVCLMALVGIVISVFLPFPAWGRGLIIFAHLLSIIVELINSAIEAAVDHTSLEHHVLAKRAKDLGSAAQLISLLNMAAIWGIALLSFV